MKKYVSITILSLLMLLFCSCGTVTEPTQVVATTLPVYEFTSAICADTDIAVSRLITENISCLHDYTLQVSQIRAIEAAEVVIISGAGLETFLDDALENVPCIIDASEDISLICDEAPQEHDHSHTDHHHEEDPHIWLSPKNAMQMCVNICQQLSAIYPHQAEQFAGNTKALLNQLEQLQAYSHATLKELSCRELITFHDGFAYMADAFDLHILEAIEEESGSEASAAELIELTKLVQSHQLPAIFTEASGSTSAAQIISAETGAKVCSLDMAMANGSYFDAMYQNINTIKEALG